MRRIALTELTPLELNVLENHIRLIGYTEAEIQFIHNTLFRDEEGVAYYPSRSRKALLAICAD